MSSQFNRVVRDDGSIEYVNPEIEQLMASAPQAGEPLVIPQAEVDAYISTAYQRSRAAEYPPIGDQLDALWKGGDAAAEMLAKVQAVKNKYPKPE